MAVFSAKRALLVALVASAACMFPDLSGLSGGDAAVPIDATIDAPTMDASDGGVESAPVDAGTDARFCVVSSGHSFCEDFDNGNAWQTDWDNTVLKADASIALDDAAITSPPSSIFIQNQGSTAFIAASLSKHFGIALKHATVQVDARIDQRDDACTYVHFLDIDVNPIASSAYSTYHVYLQTESPNKTQLTYYSALADGGTASKSAAFNESFAQTRRATVDLDLIALQASVALDGVQVASIPVPALEGVASVDVLIGAMSASCPSPPVFTVHYDSVLIDVH